MPPALSRRSQSGWVVVLAVLAGVVASLSGVSPTGVEAFDLASTAVVVGLLTWISAVAPWWALLTSSSIAVATTGGIPLTVVSGCALLASAWVGTQHRMARTLRAGIAGTILNVLLRSELNIFVGASAIVGCAVATLLAVSAARRRTRRQRRWIASITITLGIFGFLATAVQGASVLAARATITNAVKGVRSGIDLLEEGDAPAAVERLNLAVRDMDWALRTIDSGWTSPARLVPIVAQNRHILVTLAEDARSLTQILASQLERIDLEAIKPKDGKVDLEQIRKVSDATEQIVRSLENLRSSLGGTNPIWLAEPVARVIRDLRSEIDLRLSDAQNARDSIQIAPSLLGADGPRRYFIAFTTPAEARGGGGFMGNWAEVVADGGRIALERTGRTRDLNEVGWPERRVTGPEEFLARYGAMGFAYPESNRTAPDVWSVINLSSHFPSTAQVIAELYPQSGGKPLDGVISLDAYALATLVDFSGPLMLTTINETLTGENAAEFLLYDQYRLEDTSIERVDVLEEVTQKVVERILDGMLPESTEVAKKLLPLVRSGRIVAYSVHEEEQERFERLHMDGALEGGDSGDALSISFNNANANKIDVFLNAKLTYDVTLDAEGRARSTAFISLTNSAPTSGWPRYTIGNGVGLPDGWNRLWVTVHSRLKLQSASVNGVEATSMLGSEEGLYTTDLIVDIAPGSVLTITLDFMGALNVDPLSSTIPVTLRLPAAVQPVPAIVSYTGPDGEIRTAMVDRPGTHRGLSPSGGR